jgi:hypothetical protein
MLISFSHKQYTSLYRKTDITRFAANTFSLCVVIFIPT